MTRDYNHFVNRVHASARSYMEIIDLESIGGYPIYSIALKGRQRACRHVLLTAGLHGDEPAGPEAILRFLERDHSSLLHTFDFFILPCINPYGFVHNTRENATGLDINRSFEEDTTPEAILVKRTLQGRCFDTFVEFHEDWEFDGFYLFELQRSQRSIGPKIIESVKQIGPIYSSSSVDDMPVEYGVVQTDLEMQEIGKEAMPRYVFRFHADHCITSETPTRWDIESRISAHLTVLDIALQSYLNGTRDESEFND